MNVKLFEWLECLFKDGLQYEDAVELCKALYCTVDFFPKDMRNGEYSMQQIADAFSKLSKRGIVKNYLPYRGFGNGASYHSIEDRGHWIEVQASITKLGTTYNQSRVQELLKPT